MSPFLVTTFLAVGASTWIYNKFQRTSGNNTTRSLTAAGICGLLIFVVFFYIFSKIMGS